MSVTMHGMTATVALAVGFGAGAWTVALHKDRTIANMQREAATQLMRQADATSMRLYQAQTLGDRLTRDLAAARRSAQQLSKERDHAIAQATTGRVCLDGAALGVLDGAPGITLHLPDAASGTDGAHADRVATDTDVGHWTVAAGGEYAECVRRYHGLIDWHASTGRQQ